MKIKIWGCCASITTPGPSTLRYGGNSTCLEIRSDDGKVIVIDAGSGVRHLGKALRLEPAVSEIRFFITHSRWDHLVGFPFFEPAYFDSYKITFCSGPHAEDSIQKYLSHQMEPPYFPIALSNLNANFNFRCEYLKRENGYCPLGSLQCHAFPLNHPHGGYGFKYVERGKTFYLSDRQ